MDERERASLVERNLDLPRRLAATVHVRCREHVELDELIALGNAGLVEAAARFDPSVGVSFRTFAHYRVQGSIIDGLRKMTTLPRRVWAKLTALRAASDYLENRGMREAGAARAGAAEKTTAEALSAVQTALGAIRTVYLTSLAALGDEEPAAESEAADAQLDRARLARRMTEALESLPDRERQLVVKHYWEGKNLLEAGAELGISKSWASRLHAQAVERLRRHLRGAADP